MAPQLELRTRRADTTFYLTVTAGSAGAPTSTYASNANPITVDQTGKRYFYSDASGVLRYNTTATASSADAALQ